MDSESPIEFEVRYGLTEYLAFAQDVFGKRLPKAIAAAGKPMSAGSVSVAKAAALPLSFCAFWLKSGRIGRCAFRITPTEIIRRTRSGENTVAWSQITEVYACGPGLVLGKPGGGMPIPDRALSNEQRAKLREWVRLHGLAIE